MLSRITIDMDFDNNNLPVIKIIQEDSEDVRDKLLSSFLQSLAHSSRWIKIEYQGEFPQDQHLKPYKKVWQLTPIKPNEITEEIKLMNAVITATEIVPQ